MPHVTGRVAIRVNGELLLTKTGAQAFGIGGFEREPVIGSSGVHGYTEKPDACRCEFSLTDRDDKNLTDLARLEDATVTFEAVPSGKVYILREAFCKSNLSVKEGDGEVPVVFFGTVWEEQLA